MFLLIRITLGLKGLYTAKLQYVTLSDTVSNSTGAKFMVHFYLVSRNRGGTRCSRWLRHCATSRKVAGSIPDGVIDIFHGYKSSDRTVALVLTQPLKKCVPGIFPGE